MLPSTRVAVLKERGVIGPGAHGRIRALGPTVAGDVEGPHVEAPTVAAGEEPQPPPTQ